MKNETLMTTAEVARILEVGEVQVRRLHKEGKIPALRTHSGIRLFTKSDVLKLREERLANPPKRKTKQNPTGSD